MEAAPAWPLRPVEADYTRTLQRVAGRSSQARTIAREAIAAGVTDVLFVGVGGSWSSSVHACTLLESRARRLTVRNVNAAEFTALPPARLGPTSLVIASSHSGGTPETVAAARFAREAGARVVAVSRDDDNPLVHQSHDSLSYGSERTVTPSKQILLALLAVGLLVETGEPGDHGAALRAYEALPEALRGVLDRADRALGAAARELATDRPIYVVASGSGFGAAFTLSLCYLMEMQWMDAGNIAAGDFLHGPFEMLTDEASLVVFQGEDPTRGLTERVARFAARHGNHVVTLDSKDYALPGVPDALRGDVSAIVIGALGSRLADHMEAVTGHSLDDRRYMNRVAY